MLPVPAPAARVLTRALVGWGLGHLAMGDRRGWALLTLQVVWLVALVGSVTAWLGSDRWMLVFGLVCGYLAVWTLQACHAYRRAVELDAGSIGGGGAARITVIAPVSVALITLVFLVGGRVATPGATFERYIHSWQTGDAGTAAALFIEPPSHDEVIRGWESAEARLMASLAAMAPPGSGPPPGSGRALSYIRFEYPAGLPADRSSAQVDLLIVENVRIRTTVLGIFPASSQENRVIGTAGRAILRREPTGPSLPFLPAAGVWRIERVEID